MKSVASHFPWNTARIFALRKLGNVIGKDVYLGSYLTVITDSKIKGVKLVVGDRVSIAPNVTIILSSGPNNSSLQKLFPVHGGTVVLSDDCWIGTGAILYPGVKIGESAIVNAGSVVTKDVDAFTMVGGVPAKMLKTIDI